MHPESQCPVLAIQCPVFVPQCPVLANERVYIDSLIHYSHLLKYMLSDNPLCFTKK